MDFSSWFSRLLLGLMVLSGFIRCEGFEAHINFQTNGAPVPAGYVADVGQKFGNRGNGLWYGWNEDITGDARDRNSPASPDQRFDTFIYMNRYAQLNWEIVLTNGIYVVSMAAGDPTKQDGVYRIEAEGVLTVNGTPEGTNNWVQGTAVVWVKDGRLTITDGLGAFNNRLCFVDIRSAIPLQMDQLIKPSFHAAFTCKLQGDPGAYYQVDATSDLRIWRPLARGLTDISGISLIFGDQLNQQFYRARRLLFEPPVLVYTNHFESGVGPEWSTSLTAMTPVGTRRFLGQFGVSTATLTLSQLPAHDQLTVSVDLYIIGSWDGKEGAPSGPDLWELNLSGGPTLLRTSFRNTYSTSGAQCYPGWYPEASFPAFTGATESDSLGYSNWGDLVYRLSFTLPHSASSVQLNFVGNTSESLGNESWGIDNVAVSVRELR